MDSLRLTILLVTAAIYAVGIVTGNQWNLKISLQAFKGLTVIQLMLFSGSY